MSIPLDHPHVDGANGLVYLPYLSEWRPHSSTVHDAVVAMANIFSTRPPVVSRPPQYPSSPFPVLPPPRPSLTSPQCRIITPPRPSSSSSPPPRLIPPLTSGLADADDRARICASLSSRLRTTLAEHTNSARANLSALRARQAAAHDEIHRFTINRNRQIALTTRCTDLRVWHATHPDVSSYSIESILRVRSVPAQQALSAVVDDLALADLLDILDDAVSASVLPPDAYVRLVRRFARDQFFARALLAKIYRCQGPLFIEAAQNASIVLHGGE